MFAFMASKPLSENGSVVWSDAILVILPPQVEPPRAPAVPPPPRPSKPERIRRPTRQPVQAEANNDPVPDPVVVSDVPDSLIVIEPAPAVDLVVQAKRDLVKVERALAKTQRPDINGPPKYESALAKGIEAAFKPRGLTIKEYVLPDGRRMSKVGAKCHVALDNHTIMAEAYRTQGRATKQVPCPPN
jgi:hypothetical protein